MKYKQNLHTHTTFCDGRDTPEEMVARALELGFDTLGFSKHSYTPYSDSYIMTPEVAQEKYLGYKAEIARLKEKYRTSIRILCGYEADMYSTEPLEDFDYVIGSLHYPKHLGKYVNMDRSADTVAGIIDSVFSGDGMAYAKCFFSEAARLPEIYPFDVVGHFDLLAKHCESRSFFDTESREYRGYALEALHAIAEKIKIFEVNTGAIARGYRTTPYPAPFIMKELKALGCGVIISSDCHDKNYLDCYFDEALDYVRACGFDRIAVYGDGGFDTMRI